VRDSKESTVPKANKTSRGGSKRGKYKPGKNRKGQGKKTMKGLSTRKDQIRD
jgi:hypothetical protein